MPGINWNFLHWMLQLSKAAACLESIGYAHGDINPQDILFDENDRVKLIDFDHCLKVRSGLDVGYKSYVRQFREYRGSPHGIAGQTTEQFALGSAFWYMTRRTELYSELKGPEKVNRLRDGILPTIVTQNRVDCIINKCWNGEYVTIADLLRRSIQGLVETASESPVDIYASQKKERILFCEQYCRATGIPLDSLSESTEAARSALD